MTTQETKLAAIANAIRAKEGSSAPIPASDFASRIRALETENAVQNTHWKNMDRKLDELTAMVRDLTAKPGKRWEGLVEKALWAVTAAVIAFLLGRIGL